MKKLNILITGGAISKNEGAVAMTLVASKLIKKIFPNSTISILILPHKESFLRNKYLKFNICPLKKFNFKIIKQADLIIDVSGDMLNDDYGLLSTCFSFKELLTANILRKPIIIFPQSIGPFNYFITKKLSKFVLNRCRIVIPREKITSNLLKNKKIKKLNNIIDDSAFLLEPVSEEQIEKIMKKENIKKERENLLIGISLSQSIAKFSKGETNSKYDEYVKKMVSFVNYLTSKKKASLVFIPHVGKEESPEADDRTMCNFVYSKAKDKDKIKIMQKKRYWPQEFKGVISKCDLFIGSRMHANIAALSTNVPTIAVAYSHKTYGIMERFKQGKYVCDIMKLNEKEIIDKIEDLLKNKNQIEKQLKMKNKEIQKNEKILGKIIQNALKFKPNSNEKINR